MRPFSIIYVLLVLYIWSVPKSASCQTPSSSPTPEQIAERRKRMEEQLRSDWAQTKKYAAQNERLIASGTTQVDAVYIGDSITEFWWKYDSAFWKDNGYIDRGISGQTSSQMLVRFRRDVVNLRPQVVVINAGTNDIAENTGPIALEHVFGNIVSMSEIAKANNIKVVLTAVLPAAEFPWKKDLQPAEKVLRLNAMVKDYATRQGFIYVDYWTPLANQSRGLDSRYSSDGVHPNLAGYQIMEGQIKPRIDQLLKKNTGK